MTSSAYLESIFLNGKTERVFEDFKFISLVLEMDIWNISEFFQVVVMPNHIAGFVRFAYEKRISASVLTIKQIRRRSA